MKTSILIAVILIAFGVSVQPQVKKATQSKPVKAILAKADSVIADSLLPDTVLALKKEVEQLGKELDKLNALSKQKLKSESKLNTELKNQGAALARLANTVSNVDTIPVPALGGNPIPLPDSLSGQVATEEKRRNLFERIFNRHRK